MCNHLPPEPAMTVVSDGIWCDPCIAPIVKALNQAGLATVASCCGHGDRLGTVTLKDGRWLVITPDAESVNRLANGPTAIAGVDLPPSLEPKPPDADENSNRTDPARKVREIKRGGR